MCVSENKEAALFSILGQNDNIPFVNEKLACRPFGCAQLRFSRARARTRARARMASCCRFQIQCRIRYAKKPLNRV